MWKYFKVVLDGKIFLVPSSLQSYNNSNRLKLLSWVELRCIKKVSKHRFKELMWFSVLVTAFHNILLFYYIGNRFCSYFISYMLNTHTLQRNLTAFYTSSGLRPLLDLLYPGENPPNNSAFSLSTHFY